jgi:hypothetical protein
MRILSYEFEWAGNVEPLRDPAGAIVEFAPQALYNNVRNLPLNRYGAGPFCRFKIPKRLQGCGVYIMVAGNDIRYVGECADFVARFNAGYGNISPKNCYRGGQETNCRLNNLIYLATVAGEQISLWFLQTERYKLIEQELRRHCSAPWNRV